MATDPLLAATSTSETRARSATDFVAPKDLFDAPVGQQPASADGGNKVSPKSLFFCLVVDNPFDPARPPARAVRMCAESRLRGQPAADGNPPTHLCDDDFLLSSGDDDDDPAPPSPPAGQTRVAADTPGVNNASVVSMGVAAVAESGVKQQASLADRFLNRGAKEKPPRAARPTRHQKLLELLLRMRSRGIDFYPEAMLERCPTADDGGGAVPATGAGSVNHVDGAASDASSFDTIVDPNRFHGWRLNRRAMLLSPDEDEVYITIHIHKRTLLDFADRQGLELATNPFSCAGGGGVPFSHRTEKALSDSVARVEEVTGELPDGCGTEGKKKTAADGTEKWEVKPPYGFLVEVPQKMRLAVRLLREGWRFGGCGVQLNELRAKGVFVRQFCPLHNAAYQSAYGLDRWSSFRTIVSCDPLQQDTAALVKYFGERVTLYFLWLKSYILFLRVVAFLGVVASVLYWAVPQTREADQSLIGAVFSFVLVTWGFAWCKRWRRIEADFASEFQQDVEKQQELVRDEFRPASEAPLTLPDLLALKFEYPLTLAAQPDGSLIQLAFPNMRRTLTRVLLTYPIVIVLTLAMVAALVWLNWFRFEHTNSDKALSYLASGACVAVSLFFGKLFDIAIPFLNDRENNRTDSEETQQFVFKSFCFYFFSSYFTLFSILLWPGQHENDRLEQLTNQMVVSTLLKPVLQNVQEIALPWLMAQLRQRSDLTNSACKGACSMLCCRSMEHLERDRFGVPLDPRARRLWAETQREPYDGGNEDYLEITLQFGHMLLFSSAFVLAPSAALLFNVLELRLDARKILALHQRPIAQAATGIGAWHSIFWALAALSAVTNAYIVCVLSDAPAKLGLRDATSGDKFHWFAVMQYFYAAAVALILVVWRDEPAQVLKRTAMQALLRSKTVRKRMFSRRAPADAAVPPSATDRRAPQLADLPVLTVDGPAEAPTSVVPAVSGEVPPLDPLAVPVSVVEPHEVVTDDSPTAFGVDAKGEMPAPVEV